MNFDWADVTAAARTPTGLAEENEADGMPKVPAIFKPCCPNGICEGKAGVSADLRSAKNSKSNLTRLKLLLIGGRDIK